MANSPPVVLKISSNLEIPQSNRKNLPTENESNSVTENRDEKDSESVSQENQVAEATNGIEGQDEECLKAEKLLKALLSIDTTEINDSSNTEENPDIDLAEKDSDEHDVSSQHKEEYSESNSNYFTDWPTIAEAAITKRKRRRPRKRKVTEEKDTNEHLTTDSEVKLTTSMSKSSSSTTCLSNAENTEVVQGTAEESTVKSIEGSDSAISQDETYQDLITEDFVLDFEQRMIKENLFIEHEKLAKEVEAFELELNAQLQKTEVMEESLKQLKTNNEILLCEKTRLLDEIKTKEEEIGSLKNQTTSLKTICDEFLQKEEREAKTSYIDLDKLKSQLLAKEDEFEFAKRKHENEYNELAKNHGMFVAEILTEAQEMNTILQSSAKTKPAIRKTNNVLQLLKQLKEDILALSDKSGILEITVKQLRDEVECQAKALAKVTSEKKILKEQVAKANEQNKALVKEKAKLERDKETLKAEAARAKNMSQTCKARLEELKANTRSAKREKDVVLRKKQDIEMELKNLGIDYKSLLSNETDGKVVKNGEQQNVENNSTNQVPKQMKGTKENESSEEVRELDTTVLAKPNDETNEQACKLKDILTRITKDGFCLKRTTELIAQGYLNVELLTKSLYCHCGCYKNDSTQKQFLENFPSLARRIESLGKSQIENKMIKDLGKELHQVKSENNLLKQERGKHEKSLENYKELVRGYSHIVNELEERVVGVREMKCIIRELEKYSVLLEQQKEGVGIQLLGVNIIHAMFQRLKRFAGNFMNTDLSSFSNDSMEHTSLQSLEQTNKFLKEKLAYSEYNISSLKATLERKRIETAEVQIQIDEALFAGNEQRPIVESPEQKTCKRAKGNGILGFMKRKSENDSSRGNAKSALLSEKQLAVVIDLVQCREQLVVGIQESIDLEQGLERLAKASREYLDILQRKDSRFDEKKIENASVADLELLKCFKEKERVENEFSFKEAQIRLLEKQIALLKSERKACLKALRRYEEEMKTFAPNSIVSALAKLLSTYRTSDERKPNGKVVNGVKDSYNRGRNHILCHGYKGTISGSNV